MDKAKAFFLTCAGILMLAIAMDIGTEQARADYDPEAGGPVVAFKGNAGSAYTLLENGECWRNVEGVWFRQASYDLPIPLSELAFYEGDAFIATNGDFWRKVIDEWVNTGAPPVGTPAQSSSWSQLKGNFGK